MSCGRETNRFEAREICGGPLCPGYTYGSALTVSILAEPIEYSANVLDRVAPHKKEGGQRLPLVMGSYREQMILFQHSTTCRAESYQSHA
jgi:hypothetical protein